MIARVFILLKNWKTLLTAESISFKFKVVYFFSLLTTLPFKKYVFWLGDRFYVDGRLSALMLPSHLDEIKYLLSEAPDDQNNFLSLTSELTSDNSHITFFISNPIQLSFQ